ncbi:hypothetical protein [Micromonospora chokoriensis]|uniref:Uncharacterized protein n=1 Tax=Micromonospora chokoriensis TaxID=356851 RepID=A0A1C4WL93_9ACTN|nr:hypothetical protein [Micromonospora chokoriensis]SCE96661.1 hypothetical protein GA0070612_2572 [Micromonospora chokoriensis]
MPARRNPKKSRKTPLGTNPTTEHGRPRATRPDLDLAVEPAIQAERAALADAASREVLAEPALPAVRVEPALPAVRVEPAAVLDELTTSIDVPAAVDAPTVGALPKSAGRPAAPTAGPPQGGGGRAGGGRSRPAGQTRRYAFRRS